MRGCYFANNVSNVVVETRKFTHKLVRSAVRVVVTDGIRRLRKIESLFRFAGITRCGRSNHLNVRVCFLDGIVKHLESVLAVRFPSSRVSSEPVLVANFDVIQLKGFGVAKCRALCTPGGISGSRNKLDLVECVFNEGLERIFGSHVTVESKSTPDCEHFVKLEVRPDYKH